MDKKTAARPIGKAAGVNVGGNDHCPYGVMEIATKALAANAAMTNAVSCLLALRVTRREDQPV